MRRIFFISLISIYFISCKKENAEEDTHSHETPTADTTIPVINLNSPIENSIFHNGDTVFISGTVTDNEMHSGTILLKNDTTSFEYMNQYHNVHGLSSAVINFYYVVSGISQNESVTLTLSYEDHAPNYGTALRHLLFLP